MSFPRFRIRTLMIAVATVGLFSLGGRDAIQRYLWPAPRGQFYRGRYRAPDGKVIRGTVIYVAPSGLILVD